MLDFCVTSWELCVELLDLQGMLLVPGGLTDLGLIWD